MSTLQRIEQLISAYESRAFMLRMRVQGIEAQATGKKVPCKTEGPVTHASSLREHINEIGIERTLFDAERYLPLRDGQMKGFGMLGSAPSEILAWSALSRRVYAPTLDAQTILSASKLDAVTWADVEWPFDAFAIALAEPLTDPHGDAYDTILVFRERLPSEEEAEAALARMPAERRERNERFFAECGMNIVRQYEKKQEQIGEAAVIIRLIGPSLERAIVTKDERKKTYDLLRIASVAQRSYHDVRTSVRKKRGQTEVAKRAADKAWHQYWTHLDALDRRMKEVVIPFFPISIDRHGDVPVTQSVDELRKSIYGACTCGKPNCFQNNDHPELELAAQLVVGLCLYLRTAPNAKRPLMSEWGPLPLLGQIVPHAITTGAVCCEVRASRTFTQDERDRIIGRGPYTRKWAEIAWTKAYSRRPLGKGNDPTAERSVRIETYPSLRWYNKDLDTGTERLSAPIRLT